METVIDDSRLGDSPPLKDYGDEMAAVCQALGIKPKAWQAGGRTLAGAPFWTVQKTESDCRAFVDSQGGRFVGESGFRRRASEPWFEDQRRSHLIFAQYPEPSDAWALEAIKAAAEQGIPCEIRCDSGTWLFRFWSKAWGWLSGLPGEDLGVVVCSGLSHAMACEALTVPSAR